MRPRAAAWGALALVAVAAAPRAGRAFVCTRAQDAGDGDPAGPALAWGGRKVTYTLQASGTRQLAPLDTFARLNQGFAVWQNLSLDPNVQATCGSLPGTDMQLAESPVRSQATWVGYDFLSPGINENLLIFRDDVWPNPTDAIDVIALTTTTYSGYTGEIIDADIEFNSANFHFVLDTPGSTDTDLLNTAVHEVGHFLGLAHCGTSSCGHSEVMEPISAPGETTKRLLKCDDRAGMAFKYPAGAANGYCSASVDATCGFCAPPYAAPLLPVVTVADRATGRSGTCQAAPPAAAAPLALAWLARRPRGRRRRRRPARAAALAALVAGAAALGGCAGVECDGQPHGPAPAAPVVVDMDLFGQVSNDPWQVVLATDFVDPDGDLSGGTVSFYANHSTTPRSSQALGRLFGASGGVDPGSTSGRLALPLRFPQSTASGSVLHLGTLLRDAAGNTSNCYVMDLAFALQLAPGS